MLHVGSRGEVNQAIHYAHTSVPSFDRPRSTRFYYCKKTHTLIQVLCPKTNGVVFLKEFRPAERGSTGVRVWLVEPSAGGRGGRQRVVFLSSRVKAILHQYTRWKNALFLVVLRVSLPERLTAGKTPPPLLPPGMPQRERRSQCTEATLARGSWHSGTETMNPTRPDARRSRIRNVGIRGPVWLSDTWSKRARSLER